jgi:hypothetical protein
MPAIPFILGALISGNIFGALISVCALPCSLLLYFSVKKKLARVSAVCHISFGICISIVIAFLICVFRFTGEISVSAAKELIDPEMAENEIAYPGAEVLANTEVFKNLSDEANQLMDDLWISAVRTNELTPGFWISLGVICVAALVWIFRNMYVKKKRMEARMKY